MRLKRGSESKINCDSVGGVQPDALLVLAVLEAMVPVPGWGLVLTCVMFIVPSSACVDFFFLGAHFLLRNFWPTLL